VDICFLILPHMCPYALCTVCDVPCLESSKKKWKDNRYDTHTHARMSAKLRLNLRFELWAPSLRVCVNLFFVVAGFRHAAHHEEDGCVRVTFFFVLFFFKCLAHTHTCTYTYARTHAHRSRMQVRSRARTHTHTRTHAHTHTHTHTHTHARARAPFMSCPRGNTHLRNSDVCFFEKFVSGG
jgi:hypothetical protein